MNPESEIKGTWRRNEDGKLVIGASCHSWLSYLFMPFTMAWTSGYVYVYLYGRINVGAVMLFWIIVVVITIAFWFFSLMLWIGKVEITIKNNQGMVFTGIWEIGRKQYFRLDELKTIEERFNNGGVNGLYLVLKNQKKLTFAELLFKKRRNFILKSMQQILTNPSNEINLFEHLLEN